MIKALLAAFVALTTVTPKLEGQAALPNSRAGQAQAGQLKKAAVLIPDEPHGAERVFNKGQDLAEKLFYGYPFRLHYCCRISNLPIGSLTTSVAPLELGGLPTGSGLAIGPFAEWRSSSDLSCFEILSHLGGEQVHNMVKFSGAKDQRGRGIKGRNCSFPLPLYPFWLGATVSHPIKFRENGHK